MLWSEEDQVYRPKLEAIRPDPAAGRAPRDHIVDLKRLSDQLSTMEQTVEMVGTEALVLNRLPIERIDCQLNAYHTRWLAHWTNCKIMGKASLRLLPYAMWWFEQCHQQSDLPHHLEVWSKSRTHRVHLGRPSLEGMLSVFKHFPEAERQCLIPHIKSGQPNELLVFEKGTNWSAEC